MVIYDVLPKYPLPVDKKLEQADPVLSSIHVS